jgi:sarcosine oxidase subunit alpha
MPRAPLCGMGVCFECRVCVDGHPHALACMTLARDGMRVNTDG